MNKPLISCTNWVETFQYPVLGRHLGGPLLCCLRGWALLLSIDQTHRQRGLVATPSPECEMFNGRNVQQCQLFSFFILWVLQGVLSGGWVLLMQIKLRSRKVYPRLASRTQFSEAFLYLKWKSFCSLHCSAAWPWLKDQYIRCTLFTSSIQGLIWLVWGNTPKWHLPNKSDLRFGLRLLLLNQKNGFFAAQSLNLHTETL